MARSWRWLVLLFIILVGWVFFNQEPLYKTAPGDMATIGAPIKRQPASIIPGKDLNTSAKVDVFPQPSKPGDDAQATHPVATANEKINFLKQAFAKANVVFSAPEILQVGEKNEVDLLISFNESVEALKGQLPASGQVVSATIMGSELMSATLVAEKDALEITAVGPAEKQRVSPAGKFYWKWLISPKTPGQHTLYITVSNIIGDDYQAIQTYSRSIIIEVSAWQLILQFIQTHWEWIFATILIPLLVHVWNAYRPREEK